MNIRMSKRALVRTVSYSLALVLVLGGLATGYGIQANDYRYQLEVGSMRSLEELSSHISSIVTSLNKAMYVGTPAMMSTMTVALNQQAAAAKNALSSLPIADTDLSSTYRFLSQVGDYSKFLSRKMANGETLTDEEKQNFASLFEYAGNLADRIGQLEQEVRLGYVNIDGALADDAFRGDGSAQEQANADEQGAQGIQMNGYAELQDGYESYPTLIYDGPFSDHMLERSPLMTKNLSSVTQEEALEKAALAAGLKTEQVKFEQNEYSNMPSYLFTAADVNVGVTEHGGLVTYLLNSRAIDQNARITADQAQKLALEYLKKLGMDSMTKTYYDIQNGICTINFAYKLNEVTCYTDLIKVGVALDNGQIVSYDARGFITNHHERSLGAPAITAAEAQKSVSKNLKVQSNKLALIPTSGLNEVLTYEFTTQNDDGQHIMVYVNAKTGAEEQVLILIETDTGVLTK